MKTPISERIAQKALALGFDTVGFTSPTLPPHTEHGLYEFLGAQHHGDMAWMENRKEQRAQPHTLWPEAKTVIVLGHNYGPDANPLLQLEDKTRGAISVYAQNLDYHDVIKKKLKALARELQQEMGGEFKVFVDTAPVLEKPLAEQAGLGWQGKHTCLVSREFGSWLFLGEIFTTLEITNSPHPTPLSFTGEGSRASHEGTTSKAAEGNFQASCGSCTACLDICPTHAFTAPNKLDARKCISYLTIEHKSQIPVEFRKAIGNRIYGCDDCLAICPWNKFAQTSREAAYHPRKELQTPLLAELLTLDDAGFRAYFSKTAIKRIGRDRFVRNVLIAAGNSGDISLISLVLPLLSDASPLVRGMAVWALSQLSDASEFAILRSEIIASETDSGILEEWNHHG